MKRAIGASVILLSVGISNLTAGVTTQVLWRDDFSSYSPSVDWAGEDPWARYAQLPEPWYSAPWIQGAVPGVTSLQTPGTVSLAGDEVTSDDGMIGAHISIPDSVPRGLQPVHYYLNADTSGSTAVLANSPGPGGGMLFLTSWPRAFVGGEPDPWEPPPPGGWPTEPVPLGLTIKPATTPFGSLDLYFWDWDDSSGRTGVLDWVELQARYSSGPAATLAGGVPLYPADGTTGETPAIITFENITQPGSTSLTITTTGPAAPAGFQLGDSGVYWDISTTALYSGEIMIGFDYSMTDFTGLAGNLRLFHYEDGQWVDCTISVDTVGHIIYGQVDSLSPFGIFEHTTIPAPGAVLLAGFGTGLVGWLRRHGVLSPRPGNHVV